MRTLPHDALPNLPGEVKSLVRDGVYAMYILRERTRSGGEYVMVTRGAEFYVLSHSGDLLPTGGAVAVSEFDVAGAATFASGGDSVSINHA
jgi:hypothetical protein